LNGLGGPMPLVMEIFPIRRTGLARMLEAV
jgi:hypothetical protein